jgi:serine/threonine-protein kinase
MRVIIEVTAGPHRGQAFSFEGHDTFMVGRSRRAHFRLPSEDRFFSRIHFLVEVNPPQCRLMDMGSKNGTFVNGQRVSLIDLRDGDEIQGGKTVLRVRVEASSPRVEEREVPLAPVVSALPRLSTGPPFAAPPDEAGETCLACGGPMSAKASLCQTCRDAAEQLPQPIHGYRIIRELGSGEVGTTYLSQRESDGRATALKIFHAPASGDRRALDRFLRQAAALKLFSHPYIATLQEVGETCGRLFAAHDFVRGHDAGDPVRERGPMPIDEAVELICQALEALDHAHAHGHFHRGLKPTNVRVTPDGMVRLLDYGLAGLYRTSELSGFSLQSQGGDAMSFQAPEQITSFRQSRPFADLYAAAAVLYYLLTAQHTHDFPEDMRDRVLLVLQEEPVPIRTRRPEVPALLAEVIHRALAKEPEARFPDAASMLQALTNCGC